MIAYDHKRLEEYLGEPFPALEENDELGRILARIITDSMGDKPAKIKWSNAMTWVERLATLNFKRGSSHGVIQRNKELLKILGFNESEDSYHWRK